MGLAGVGKVERAVKVMLAHGLIRRIDHHIALSTALKDAPGLIFVRFLLNMAEVFCLTPFVAQTFFMTVKHDVVFADASRNLFLGQQHGGLLLRMAQEQIAKEPHVNL